jgi:gluconate kinase
VLLYWGCFNSVASFRRVGDAGLVAWLWLYGPPGVGKSATGFEVFRQLVERGARLGFIELDQLGMCFPTRVAQRSAAKTENLLGILDNLAASGADGVVVCGDMAETMRDVLTRAPEKPLLCRLRADDNITFERLNIRGASQYATPSGVYESHDVPAGDLDITTHPLGITEVATEILRRVGPWPTPTVKEDPAPLPPPVIDDASTVVVTGPRAVGKSMAAWQVFMASVGSGHRTAYLDLEQLGFLSPPLQGASVATTLVNVATCWTGFRNQGAERLVLCGNLDGRQTEGVRELIPSLRVVALTASPDTLLDRARHRSRHKDIWLPGDDLFRSDDTYVRRVAREAATFESGHADLLIETDCLTPTDIAARITPHWPGSITAARRGPDVRRRA